MFVIRRNTRLLSPGTGVLALALVGVAIGAVPLPASAQMTIRDYNQILSAVGDKRRDAARAEDALKHLQVFHDGMDSALAVANHAFIQAGGKPGFCLPAGAEANIILLSKVASRLLDDKDWSKQDRASVGQVAISILTAEHPCK